MTQQNIGVGRNSPAMKKRKQAALCYHFADSRVFKIRWLVISADERTANRAPNPITSELNGCHVPQGAIGWSAWLLSHHPHCLLLHPTHLLTSTCCQLNLLMQISGPHSGLHYIPSFNDLCSGAADDADTMAVEERRAHDDARKTSGPATQQNIPAKTNNKEDSWGAFETADIHKVNMAASVLYPYAPEPNE